MYGRMLAGTSSTRATHQPADDHDRAERGRAGAAAALAQQDGAATRYTRRRARAGSTNACSCLVRKPKPTSHAGPDDPADAARLDAAQGQVGGQGQQQHEQRVGVVEAEHQHGDGGQREGPPATNAATAEKCRRTVA